MGVVEGVGWVLTAAPAACGELVEICPKGLLADFGVSLAALGVVFVAMTPEVFLDLIGGAEFFKAT